MKRTCFKSVLKRLKSGPRYDRCKGDRCVIQTSYQDRDIYLTSLDVNIAVSKHVSVNNSVDLSSWGVTEGRLENAFTESAKVIITFFH